MIAVAMIYDLILLGRRGREYLDEKNLENGEKSSIFAESKMNYNENRGKQYKSDGVSKTFEQAKSGLDSGAKNRKDYATAIGKQQTDRSKELSRLEGLAKLNGGWIENTGELVSLNPLPKGFESEVFPSADGKSVIKFNNLAVSKTAGRFLDRIVAHNEFAPNVPYTILGVGKNSQGSTSIVLQQPHIEGRPTPLEKVMLFLKENGFKPAKLSTGVEGFKNDRYEISDLWKNDGSMVADNVLIDEEGNLYFIDADINYTANESSSVSETIPSDGKIDVLKLAKEQQEQDVRFHFVADDIPKINDQKSTSPTQLQIARAEIDNQIKKTAYKFRENWEDADLPVRTLLDELRKLASIYLLVKTFTKTLLLSLGKTSSSLRHTKKMFTNRCQMNTFQVTNRQGLIKRERRIRKNG